MIFLILLITQVTANWTSPVPYSIDDKLNREKIEIALEYIQTYTNWEFIQRTSEKDYIYFNHSNNGCAAELGFDNGGKRSSFIDNSCSIGVIIHEICHNLGLPHQHQYLNRDNYIKINFENIIDNKIDANFKIVNTSSVLNDFPYDFESIMHYNLWAGSKNGKKTIEIIQNPLNLQVCTIGMDYELSDIDIKKLNKLCLNCSEKSKEKDKDQLKVCGGLVKRLDFSIYGRYDDNKQVWGNNRIRYRWSLFMKNRWEIYERWSYFYDIIRAYSYDGNTWYVKGEVEESTRFNREIDKSYELNILEIYVYILIFFICLCIVILIKKAILFIIIFIIVLVSLKFTVYN